VRPDREEITLPVLLSKREAAARYNISLRQVDYLLADGILPRVQLGRKLVRIPMAKAEQVMESLTTGGYRDLA
jgi:hypothetical protein